MSTRAVSGLNTMRADERTEADVAGRAANGGLWVAAALGLILAAVWVGPTHEGSGTDADLQPPGRVTSSRVPEPADAGALGAHRIETVHPQTAPAVPPLPRQTPKDRTEDPMDLLGGLQSFEPVRALHAARKVVASSSAELMLALLERTAQCADPVLRQQLLDQVRLVDGARHADVLSARLLTPGNGDLRRAAADALVRSSSSEAARALIGGALSLPQAELQVREIGRTLARFRGEQATEALTQGVASPIPAIQAGCIAALAAEGTPEIATALSNLHESSEGMRREMIVEGFSRFRNPEAAPTLARVAEETADPVLRIAIHSALAQIERRRMNRTEP